MSGGFPFPRYQGTEPPFNYDSPFDNRSLLDISSSEPYRNNRVNAKLPIPRNASSNVSTTSGRVSRACEICREQKAKCSGHRPTCHRCQAAGVRCSYGDRKKEKILKQLNDLSTQVESLKALLCELYPKLDASSAKQVDQRLKNLNLDVPLQPSSVLEIPHIPLTISSDATADPVPAPFWGVDHTEEDFSRGDKAQAMGFVGESSEIAWLYRLKRDLDHDSSVPIKEFPERPAISSMNYFQDDSEISVPTSVNSSSWPPQHIADRLLDNYLHAVHSTFPIIGKTLFLNQYRSFYSNPSLRPGKRWLAVLNLVFAIATRHAILIDEPQTEHLEHQVYFSRACELSLGNVLLDHPDLQQTQVEGLAAFYLLSIGQVNRSWRAMGIAIRSGLAMGLNLRSETESITHTSRELRYRVWWALFLLDTVLCEITGRSPTTGHMFITTPLPIPFLEEDLGNERVVRLATNQEARSALFTSLLPTTTTLRRETLSRNNSGQSTISKRPAHERSGSISPDFLTPNASLYFLYAVDLAHLLREAVDVIYGPRSGVQSWCEVEAAISTFNGHADHWLSRLPVEFRFLTFGSIQKFVQQRTALAFQFYAAKLIILQPCLRRLTQNLSKASIPGTVCERMAATCVQVAGQMIDLLPETGDTTWLHSIAPWWCVLHNIMQATSTLLTELLTRTTPRTVAGADTIVKIKKAIHWLRKISANDQSSWRAHIVCTDLLSRHEPSFAYD